MSFCEHCEGQRYDRAQVLKVLRATRQGLRRQPASSAEEAIDRAIEAVRSLEIPHLELLEDYTDEVIH